MVSIHHISVAVLLRAFLFCCPEFTKWLERRPELHTPQTSWKRLQEGITLITHDASYENSYHGSTLLLVAMKEVEQHCPWIIPVLFAVCDVIVSLALYQFSKKYLENEFDRQHTGQWAKDSEKLKVKKTDVESIPRLVFLLYLFNPFTVATCVSKSTVVFNNTFLALFLLETISGNMVRMTLYLALSTYESLYPIQMIGAATISYWIHSGKSSSLLKCTANTMSLVLFWLALLFSLSYSYSGSVESIFSHYSYILTVPDQTPNIGVFWYFFTEVFDHFQTFFLYVFQINVVFYSIPLTIKLRDHPIPLVFILLAITATFKSYPSLGDAALWLSLLPIWSHLFQYMRYKYITPLMFSAGAILCPVMWHMWIQVNAANANFYFAATLAYTTSLVLVIADVAIAYCKWDYHLINGCSLSVSGSSEKGVLKLAN